MSATARRLTAAAVDDSDRADRLPRRLLQPSRRSGMSRLMRRRLNNVVEDFERTMYALAALATGKRWSGRTTTTKIRPSRFSA